MQPYSTGLNIQPFLCQPLSLLLEKCRHYICASLPSEPACMLRAAGDFERSGTKKRRQDDRRSSAARQEFLPSCTTCGSFYCARWCKCTSSSPAVCFPGSSTFSHPSIHFCFLWSPYSTSGLPPATSPPVRCAEKPSFNSAWLPTLAQSPPSSRRTSRQRLQNKRKSISLDHVFFPLPSKNLFSCLERILPDFNRVFFQSFQCLQSISCNPLMLIIRWF